MFTNKVFDAFLAKKLSVENNSPSLLSYLSPKAGVPNRVTGARSSSKIHTCPAGSPATTLDDFDLLKQLGKGGYGTVFLARHKITSGLYALKVVQKSRFDLYNVETLLEEQRVHCSLDVEGKQHFLPLEATWHDSENCYFLMEYCPGDLAALLHVYGGKFDLERARFYAAELLLAIEELHKQKIIHRDVKPANVLLRQNGHVYLADFGVARKFERTTRFSFDVDANCDCGSLMTDTEAKAAYVTDRKIGTAVYMAPEIFEGQRYSFEVDVWAWAVSVYEMLTGKIPFGDDDMDRDMMSMAVVEGKGAFGGVVMDGDARDLLERTLCKKRGERLVRIEEIKGHAFFEGVKWDKLAKRKTKAPQAPHAPKIPRKARYDFPIHPAPRGSAVAVRCESMDELPDELFADFDFISSRFEKSRNRKLAVAAVCDMFGKMLRKFEKKDHGEHPQAASPLGEIVGLSDSTRAISRCPIPERGSSASYAGWLRAPSPCYLASQSLSQHRSRYMSPCPSPTPTLVPSLCVSPAVSLHPSPGLSPCVTSYLHPAASPYLAPLPLSLGPRSVSSISTLRGSSPEPQAAEVKAIERVGRWYETLWIPKGNPGSTRQVDLLA